MDEKPNVGSLVQIETTRDTLYAFRVSGEVSADQLGAMAKTMNDAFSRHESVDMLLMFAAYKGAAASGMFDPDVIKAQIRSPWNVNKYVVVGAPDPADKLIQAMSAVIPVEAHTFQESEEAAAWALLAARPLPDVR